MNTYKSNSTIETFSTVSEFIKTMEIKKSDLILSSRSTFENFLKPLNIDCEVIFPANYGKGEPTSLMIDAIIADINPECTRIIAIGGGSVLDISKILALKFDGTTGDLFMSRVVPTKIRQVIAVPTTCGTGSEVTAISVCELIKEKTKKGIALDIMFPDKAVLIPELLTYLPYSVFATSSIDAFVHAAESYLSPKASHHSKLFSTEAIRMILGVYLYVKEHGKDAWKDKKEDLLIASNYAGIAFANGGCAAVHALSYPLGGIYHIPHGEANTEMFPEVFKMYQRKEPNGKFVEFSKMIADILNVAPEKALDELVSLLNVILQRKPLAEYGIPKEQLKDFAKSVVAEQQRLLGNNYVPLSEEEILEIYNASF